MTHVLTYDTLPPHSQLRREVIGGAVTITAAAEEPNSYARRVELQRSAFAAAMFSSALVAGFLLVFGSTYLSHRRYMGTALFAVLLAAFVVFCGALFLLMWRAQYAARIDRLERALRQTTILAVTCDKLLIETAGPFGQASHELVTRVGRPDCIVEFRRGWLDTFRCLEIVLASGEVIRILPGRDDAELHWVARALRGTMHITQ